MNLVAHEESLFHAVSGMAREDRAAFLDRECAGDPALRARLESLLAAHDQPETLESLDAARRVCPVGLTGFDDPVGAVVGQSIGRYRLVERLGEGGCGVVYVAEQTEPVRRRVALKLIKPGMDTKVVIARFEVERQALAMMDHPGIAKVLDAGATESGHPYFVMELVRGIRITEYCDQERLCIAERLDLFIRVCQAIQHAHQKGIIHRDVKPSNILVTLHDGVAVPKVIDFGIAKATEGRLTEATVYTQLHPFLGTPAYMSPEQAEMSGLDIDTRSDIYSLGVLLYELLTGVTPFDARELLLQGLDGMRRTIREKEPVRPSTRLTQLGRGREGRSSAVASSQLPTDLDWIVMKCLEKDRSRRYETANGLAADLRRHLNHEPVVARPPSAAYRFQKAWRRNQLAFGAGALVVIALVLGAGIAAIGWHRAMKERDAALAARQSEETQRREAQAHAGRAEAAAEEARTANRRAEQELYRARLAQAQALLSGIRPRRRREALVAIAEAARLSPSFDLRTEAIAALALTDFGDREMQSTRFWNGNLPPAFDSSMEYALGLLQPPGSTTNLPTHCGWVRLRDDRVLRELPFRGGDLPIAWHLGNGAAWSVVLCRDRTLTRWAIEDPHPLWRRSLDIRLDPWGNPNLLVTADGEEVVVLLKEGLGTFDGKTGELVRQDPVPADATHFVMSPGGGRLAFHHQARVGIWDRRAWRRLGEWPLEGAPYSLSFAPDGSALVVGVDRGEVSMFHPESGWVSRFVAHTQPVSGLAFSPEGTTLMSSSWDGLTRWWDYASFRMIGETRGKGGPAFAADGLRLGCTDGPSGASVWRVERSSVFRRLIAPRRANDGLIGLGYSFDGRWLAAGGHRGWDLWDLSVGRVVHRAEGPPVASVQFLGDGLDLFTSGEEGLRRWHFRREPDGAAPQLGPPLILATGLQDSVSRASYSPGSGLIAVAAGAHSLLCRPDGVTAGPQLERAQPETVSVASSPDGRYVVAATWKGNGVSLFDGKTGKFLRLLSPESATVAFRPDSRHLVLTMAGGYEVLDTTTWRSVHSGKQVTATGGSGPVAYSGDGRWLAMALDSRVIDVLDADTGTRLAVLTSPDPKNLFSLAFSPDGRTLAAALQTHAAIDLWDLTKLRLELAELGLNWMESPQPPHDQSPTDTSDGAGSLSSQSPVAPHPSPTKGVP